MPLDSNLPFHDRTGDAEHARPVYGRGLSLDEIERRAHTSGDVATLAIIDLCMDACGTRRSEAIERAVAMRASVQEASTAAARIAELHSIIEVLRHKQRLADEMLRAVQYSVRTYRHTKKPAPKWAAYLIDTLNRIHT